LKRKEAHATIYGSVVCTLLERKGRKIMLMRINRLWKGKGEKGQGMTEYIIIVSLIAIACLLAVGVFGSNIRNLFVKASDSLDGGQAQDADFETLEQDTVRINDLED